MVSTVRSLFQVRANCTGVFGFAVCNEQGAGYGIRVHRLLERDYKGLIKQDILDVIQLWIFRTILDKEVLYSRWARAELRDVRLVQDVAAGIF